MKALQHITKCILCAPESPFQISAHGFDPINIMMPDERIGKFDRGGAATGCEF